MSAGRTPFFGRAFARPNFLISRVERGSANTGEMGDGEEENARVSDDGRQQQLSMIAITGITAHDDQYFVLNDVHN